MTIINSYNILFAFIVMISFSSNLLHTAFKFTKVNSKFLSQIARSLATTDVYVGNIPNSIDQSGLEAFVKEKLGSGLVTIHILHIFQ
jgi:hypothetical protein